MGQKTVAWKQTQPKDIDKRTIVLVDEAGMVGTRHMGMFMKWANDNNATWFSPATRPSSRRSKAGSPLMSITNALAAQG